MAHIGPHWVHRLYRTILAQIGIQWPMLVSIVSCWFMIILEHIGYVGPYGRHSGPYWLIVLAHTGQCWFILAHIGLYWRMLVHIHIGSDWFRRGPSWPINSILAHVGSCSQWLILAHTEAILSHMILYWLIPAHIGLYWLVFDRDHIGS